MQIQQCFDQSLLNKYNTSGPRYTSYPTALEFNTQFDHQMLQQAIKVSKNRRLSLYLHIPFCHSLCYYCGCNKVVTRHRHKADIYLDYLEQEIKAQAPLFKDYTVDQIHLGGGTPSFLTTSQLTRLTDLLKAQFSLSSDAEMGIEIDPREVALSLPAALRKMGFNRISIGVQDIDDTVQKAINRVQSTEFIEQFVAQAKAAGFRSVNVDLIYGLPHQNEQTFSRTIDKMIAIDVDRISLFSYAHLPSRFAAQRKLKDEWLPNANEKFGLMRLAMEKFTDAGYELIGMDHFAKPNDELAIAQQNGQLHRNFQGYTTQGNCDLLGLGVSAISAIGDSFSQNIKELKPYYQQVEQLGHAQEKGIALSQDDVIRGYVIKQLMCNLFVDKRQVEQLFSIKFDQYFANDLPLLDCFIADGLLENNVNNINVHQKARLLIRTISMSFDAYMKRHINQQRFSRVI
ncbi:oxygen-independent coproporphyrinogen III oxidase [Thalassotalea agarivorans]|uniref:Coproporphyrinogen-III oxidase n=1 Tax=Thalassotalea agarivorans TaxID=349064 RepID=A0A1I0CRD6_THASX|nr:oxygen-independent coproporphyrinogen III oxidase [Thalassotalea agarivorans]SET22111.1 coproporphyrinogen III oxidase, anaerobic [Thalassotalea agarivorans]